MHQTIKKVTEDIEKRHHLNTAISTIMEFFNSIKAEREKLGQSEEAKFLLRKALETIAHLLSAFAPHVCEEIWEKMGHKTFLARFPWPLYDPQLAREDKVTIVVQVNGKLRERFIADRDTEEEQLKERALSLDRIKDIIGTRKVKTVIYVKNRLINIVL